MGQVLRLSGDLIAEAWIGPLEVQNAGVEPALADAGAMAALVKMPPASVLASRQAKIARRDFPNGNRLSWNSPFPR
jgi:hypothetical protein